MLSSKHRSSIGKKYRFYGLKASQGIAAHLVSSRSTLFMALVLVAISPRPSLAENHRGVAFDEKIVDLSRIPSNRGPGPTHTEWPRE